MNIKLKQSQDEIVGTIDVKEDRSSIMIKKIIKWSFITLEPILVITLITDVSIMFVPGIEKFMGDWYWLKDPFSFAVGYTVVKMLHRLFRRK